MTDPLIYTDAVEPVERRVDDLLRRMTIEEKVGQLNQPWGMSRLVGLVQKLRGTEGIPGSREDWDRFVEGTYVEELGPGCGLFMACSSIAGGPREQAEFCNTMQRLAVDQTRLGIPLWLTEAGVHGLMVPGATIFPEGLTLGSTWDGDLVGQVFAAAAREARAIGVHELSTIVCEPVRDPRLGRNCEGFTEDTYLLSRIITAIVEGVQGREPGPDKCVAELAHFPGQSQPVSGLERGAMAISERTLRKVFLPAWEAGIRAGALAIMATYSVIDGVPAHASERLLTSLLRDELEFEGIVVSEGMGFDTLIYEGVALGQEDAGRISLRAGVDVNISYESAYRKPLVDAVKTGLLAEELVDRAVRRVLRLKFLLGLFENPFTDPERAAEVVNSADHRALALDAAREGIVLLKNERGLLPLRKDITSIAVIGPNADDASPMLGDYRVPNVAQEVMTVLESIRRKMSPTTQLMHAHGCGVLGEDRSGFEKAVASARAAEVAIVVVGERGGSMRDENGDLAMDPNMRATMGEFNDVASLDLTGVQEELIQAVHATGTPTVVVLINSRALSIRWTAENIPAILEAWLPGERGGEALADVLFGDVDPAGRLPVTIPRHSGQLPLTYELARWATRVTGGADQLTYVDLPSTPLYEFGFGLSYATFEYGNLHIEPQHLPSGEMTQVSLDVTNIADRPGTEVVQLYIQDLVSSVTTPVKELRGFSKVRLSPGETRAVTFSIGPKELSMLDADLRWVTEPGVFIVMVGSSSERIQLHGELTVTAPVPSAAVVAS